MPNFVKGTKDPVLVPDKGAGKWKSEDKTADMIALKLLILKHLPHASVFVGPNASKHMLHYLLNSGEDYDIDLEAMVKNVSSAKVLFERELAGAVNYISKQPKGKYTFTSANAVNGYNLKSQSRDWFFAIGGYSVWSKGEAIIDVDRTGKKAYYMEWEYKFFDRYNWDNGKAVKIFNIEITDKFMGTFHRQGLAKEFNCLGSIKLTKAWGETKILDAKFVKKAQDSQKSWNR